MFTTATLTAHRGATLVTRDELASYEPPEAEGRWRPVKHSLIVDLMHAELTRREIQITKEEYAIQREGNYLFAALTTNWRAFDSGGSCLRSSFIYGTLCPWTPYVAYPMSISSVWSCKESVL
jgi:hypothetical protein